MLIQNSRCWIVGIFLVLPSDSPSNLSIFLFFLVSLIIILSQRLSSILASLLSIELIHHIRSFSFLLIIKNSLMWCQHELCQTDPQICQQKKIPFNTVCICLPKEILFQACLLRTLVLNFILSHASLFCLGFMLSLRKFKLLVQSL